MTTSENGYSSNVKIYLKLGNATFDVAQVSVDSLILRDDPGFDLSGDGDLVIIVDDVVKEFRVTLSGFAERERSVIFQS